MNLRPVGDLKSIKSTDRLAVGYLLLLDRLPMTDRSNDSLGSLGMQFYHRGHREDTEEDLAVPLGDDNRQIDGIVVLLIRKTSIEFHCGILIFPDVVCRKLKDNRTLARSG